MQTIASKSKHHGNKAETYHGKWFISTMKRRNGHISSVAILCDELGGGMMRYSTSSPYIELASGGTRSTTQEIARVHQTGLTLFESIVLPKYPGTGPEPEAQETPEPEAPPTNVIQLPERSAATSGMPDFFESITAAS